MEENYVNDGYDYFCDSKYFDTNSINHLIKDNDPNCLFIMRFHMKGFQKTLMS